MKLIVLLISVFSMGHCDYSYLAEGCTPIIRDWVDAHNECVKLGMILATPDTNEKNKVFKEFIHVHSLSYAFISANDLIVEDHFEWMTTGKPVTNNDKDLWLGKEPDNWNGVQDCVVLAREHFIMGWSDWHCHRERTNVVCETAPDEVVLLAKSRIPIMLDAYEKKYGVRRTVNEDQNSNIKAIF